MKTPISYYGGKQRIAAQIVKEIWQIPHTVYSEPFAGGLAVLYAKGKPHGNSDYYREAINDKNDLLTTFWRVARDCPEELERLIQLTPYSQSDHQLSREIYNNPGLFTDEKIAWAVYVQCNCSFANGVGKGWGCSTISQNQAATWSNRKHKLGAAFERLATVHIGSEDAIAFIKRWDSPQTLHYCDPPYPGTNQGHYGGYTIDDYQALCDTLDNIQGSYILSNYSQDIIPKSAQKVVEIDTVMSAANGKGIDNCDTKRTEKLWICDRSNGIREDLLKPANNSKIAQLSMF
jgi:DNA adenine methylase